MCISSNWLNEEKPDCKNIQNYVIYEDEQNGAHYWIPSIIKEHALFKDTSFCQNTTEVVLELLDDTKFKFYSDMTFYFYGRYANTYWPNFVKASAGNLATAPSKAFYSIVHPEDLKLFKLKTKLLTAYKIEFLIDNLVFSQTKDACFDIIDYKH